MQWPKTNRTIGQMMNISDAQHINIQNKHKIVYIDTHV